MPEYTGRFWTDVFAHPSGVASCYVVDDGDPQPGNWKRVKIEVAGVVIKTTDAPNPPNWMRGAANPSGNYLLVAQGAGLLIYDSLLDTWVTTGVCFGQRPVGVGWNGSAFIIICQDSSTTYRRIVYGTSDTQFPIPIGITSQGLLQVTPGSVAANDAIRWTDTNRTIEVGGQTLYLPVFANGVWLGQWNGAGALAVLEDNSVSLVSGIGPEDPRIAFANGQWLSASWGLNTAQFLITSPPWPNLTPGGGSGVPSGGGGTGLPGGGGIVAPTVLTNSAQARVIERALPRLYHETDQIKDAHTQRAARLLWDRTYDLSDQMKAVDTHVGDFTTRLAALETAHAETRQMAESAGIAAGKAVSVASQGIAVGQPTVPGPSGPTIPPTPPPGTPPGTPPVPAPSVGDFQTGINTAGPTGHVTAASPTYTLAGQVVGGTVREWAALTAPAGSSPARTANVNELTSRIFWHLGQAGIPCATNLSEQVAGGGFSSMEGTIWFNIQGVQLAYILFDFNGEYVDYTAPLLLAPVGCAPVQGFPAAGIPD